MHSSSLMLLGGCLSVAQEGIKRGHQLNHLLFCTDGNAKTELSVPILLGPYKDVASAEALLKFVWILEVAKDEIGTRRPKHDAMALQILLESGLGPVVDLLDEIPDILLIRHGNIHGHCCELVDVVRPANAAKGVDVLLGAQQITKSQ